MTDIRLSDIGRDVSLENYYKGAWRSSPCGVKLGKNINASIRFCMVLHQNKMNPNDVLCEILKPVSGNGESNTGYEFIDPAWAREFVKGSPYQEHFVERNGRWFIKGICPTSTAHRRPCFSLCQRSNGASLVMYSGHGMAYSLAWPDKVKTMAESLELHKYFYDILEFEKYMNGQSVVMGFNPRSIEYSLSRVRNQQKNFDDKLREAKNEYNKHLNVLLKYGVIKAPSSSQI